jgi:hypothetical protein
MKFPEKLLPYGWQRIPRKETSVDDPRRSWYPVTVTIGEIERYEIVQFSDLFYTDWSEEVNGALCLLVHYRCLSLADEEGECYNFIMSLLSMNEKLYWLTTYDDICKKWRSDKELFTPAEKGKLKQAAARHMKESAERKKAIAIAKAKMETLVKEQFVAPFDPPVNDLPIEIKNKLYGPFCEEFFMANLDDAPAVVKPKEVKVTVTSVLLFKPNRTACKIPVYEKKQPAVFVVNKLSEIVFLATIDDFYYEPLAKKPRSFSNFEEELLIMPLKNEDFSPKVKKMETITLTIKWWPNYTYRKFKPSAAPSEIEYIESTECKCGAFKVKESYFCKYCYTAAVTLKLDRYANEIDLTHEAIGLSEVIIDKLKKIKNSQKITKFNLAFIEYKYEKMRRNTLKYIKYCEKKKRKKMAYTELKAIMAADRNLKKAKLESAIVTLAGTKYYVQGSGDIEEIKALDESRNLKNEAKDYPFLIQMGIETPLKIKSDVHKKRFLTLLRAAIERILTSGKLDRIKIDLKQYVFLKNAFSIIYNLVDNDLKPMIEALFDIIESNGTIDTVDDKMKKIWECMYQKALYMVYDRIRKGGGFVDPFKIIMFMNELWYAINYGSDDYPALFAARDTIFLL